VTEPTDTPGVRLEADGPLARITLARPERHNALGSAEVSSLLDMLEHVDSDQAIRVLVLTGEGDTTFCSGASLREMRTGQMSGERFDGLTRRLAGSRVPTICRLNGRVYGGGAELALCCDFRIGTPAVRLSVPAARLGVCYPPGGLQRYVSRLGLTSATRILLAAEEMDADELSRIGYLTSCVDGGALDDAVDTLAARLATLAPLAVQAMKRILLDIVDGSLDAEQARRLVARVDASSDLQEGLAAWSEAREPRFDGR
jgi:enoyl-CoA hydratase/carnithine racemase